MNTLTHIIYTPFTGLGHNNGYGGDEWFKNRIEVFKTFTHKALLNQNNRDFIHWLSFREEERSNPLVKELEAYLNQFPEYTAVFTFEGLMFRDDRFDAEHERNSTLLQRMARVMEGWKDIIKTDWVYLTRIDSDDMFAYSATQEIQEQQPFEGSLIFQNGYIYKANTGEMAEWNPLTCPPFYTIMFKKNTFLNAKKHLDYMRTWKTHEETIQFPHKYLSDGQYCVTIHDNHLSTNWEHRFKGQPVEKPDNFSLEFNSLSVHAPKKDVNELAIIETVREMKHYDTLVIFKNSPTAEIEFKLTLKKPKFLKKQ